MEENEGISLGDIFRTIFTQKWLALIIAVAITLVGVLGILFVYNPGDREYEITFNLNLPGMDVTSSSYAYPDGKIMYFADMVSLNNLREIQSKNPDKFKDIKVEEMANSGAIQLDTKIETTELSAAGDYLVERWFTLKVKAGYFDGMDSAREFMMAIITAPGEYLSEMKIDYKLYLALAENAIDYNNQITYLQNQYSYLVTHYNTLINAYDANFTVKDDRTLQSYLQELTLYNERNEMGNLKTEARENAYLKSETLREKYKLDKIELERDYVMAENTLKLLLDYSSSPEFSGNAAVIKEQSDYVNRLDRQIKDLDKYINEGTVNEVFNSKILDVSNALATYTTEYEEVATLVYAKASTVTFITSNIITTTGGIGTLMAILISLVIGVIVAAIVAFIVGRQQMKKKAGTADNHSASEAVAAQAAVTESEE